MKNPVLLFLMILAAVPNYALGDTYVSPMPSLGLTLDPVKATEGFSLFIINQMCDRLVGYDEKLNVIPIIAKNWKISEDGKHYTFELRNDLRFSNGRPLTASDVVWSLRRLLSRKSPKYYELAYIVGAEAYHKGASAKTVGIRSTSTNEITIDLSKPYPPILYILAAPGAEIFPALPDTMSEDIFFNSPICRGPYRIADRDDRAVRLERNDFYDQNNRVKSITFRKLNREAAIECFTKGECHDLRWYFVKPGELAGEYRVEHFPVAHVNIIAFNTTRHPFSNIDVRRAIAMAINREELFQICYPDKNIALGYIPPGLGGYDTNAQTIPYNIGDAKKLLRQSGISASGLGERYTLLRMSNYACHDGYKQSIEESLKQIGMDIRVRYVEPDVLIRKYYNRRNYDMLNITMTSDYPEALFLLNYFRSSYSTNFTGIKDNKIDELLDQSIDMKNRYDRYELYRAIQKRITELAPITSMYYDIWTTYYRNNVVGYKNTSLAVYNSSIRDVRIINEN